jgi:hypothetical protein
MDRKRKCIFKCMSLLIVDHFDGRICVTALLSIYFPFPSFSLFLFIMTKDKNDDREKIVVVKELRELQNCIYHITLFTIYLVYILSGIN